MELRFRLASPDDTPRLQAIRAAAFAPVFASFRELLGDEIYELSQRRDEEGHGALLDSLLASDSPWEVYVAESGEVVAGFIAVQANAETLVGELGLNAVDPAHAGAGIGTKMYEFAVARLKQLGMNVAMVGTGGDPSHAPARRAYEKAGFGAELPTIWMFKKL
jgi:GNAT superfamily N-acetyltransferase